jgi:hypothetical protein
LMSSIRRDDKEISEDELKERVAWDASMAPLLAGEAS